MNTNKTWEELRQLKLQGMASRYSAILEQPLHQQRTQMYLKLAKLRYSAHVEQVNCKPESGITPEQLIRLSDCSFIEKSENILITGATGCGKSYLACALGRQACVTGHKVLYYPMNRFIEQPRGGRLHWPDWMEVT